jgi:SAM-dependent methyltransferase
MRIIELAECPACGSEALRTFDLGSGNHLRRCEHCATVSAPDYADPAEVYVDGYMFGEAGPFGLDVRAPKFQGYLLRVARRRVRALERATGLRRGSLLDLGSGTGEVLLAARDRGWRAQGVEPEHTAAQMARDRGLDVIVARLQEAGLPERSFDVICAFHVLEHQPDSRKFLETMARWVRPGGFVAIEVPNWQSMQRRRLGERWSGLRPHEHLVHFTPTTLAAAFRAAGIEPVSVRSPAYVGPPQSLDEALWDLVRPAGRLRRLLVPLCRRSGSGAGAPLIPTRAAWLALRAVEAAYDAAGAGAVVVCVGRVA